MRKEIKSKRLFGLLGKDISYSFSRDFFAKKFEQSHLSHCEYINFDIANIAVFPTILEKHKAILRGFNVTIPYKLSIFNYLDKISKEALKVGAVNAVKITKKGKLKGFNTDVYGFEKSLSPLLKQHHTSALVLGTGGAAKAVAFVLKKKRIDYRYVSRNPQQKREVAYASISKKMMQKHSLIINCTPVGTHPNIQKYPAIPYEFLTEKHLLYDLIYNPSETTFLTKGKQKNAQIKNGLEMLGLQAEQSWRIWNS